MDKNQANVIKKFAIKFFHAAREYLDDKVGQKEIQNLSSGLSLGGPLFGMDDDVAEKQKELVDKCIATLGVELGSDEEIEKLAWEHVWKSYSDPNSILDITEITQQFFDDIIQYEQRRYGYLAPNYVIKFSEQVQKIVIGPVEVIKTEYLVADQKIVQRDKTIWQRILVGEKIPMEIQAGSKYGMSISNNRILLELPQSCWYIPVNSINAARRNVEEQAIWLINIAIGILRLCYPDSKRSSYPKLGDVEEMPLTEPKKFWLGARLEGKGLVLNGSIETAKKSLFDVGISTPVSSSVNRILCTYDVDDAVADITTEQGFKYRAQKIFYPAKNSLSERFGQGLGWLSRGRQTEDRAERFLFFFTAIEALLSSYDNNTPVVQTISRHASTILHTDAEKRWKFARHLRSLYKIRSALVHTGKRNISQAHTMEIQRIAEDIYKTVMERYPLDRKISEFQESLSRASYGLL